MPEERYTIIPLKRYTVIPEEQYNVIFEGRYTIIPEGRYTVINTVILVYRVNWKNGAFGSTEYHNNVIMVFSDTGLLPLYTGFIGIRECIPVYRSLYR